MYSNNMRSQAGLRVIALIIILIISLASAAPVPYPHNIQRDSTGIATAQSNHHPLISTHSVTTGVITSGNKDFIEEDNRLVRRGVGAKIKKAFQNVGAKIKSFVKNTAGKVAKFGLKVVSTIQNAASKVANFIPGVGKIIGKGLEAESKVTGLISDKIHANLGKKLEKGMKVMNTANKVMKFVPRHEEGAFQRR